MIFYYVIYKQSYVRDLFIPDLMISAGRYWQKRKFSIPNLFPHKRLFIDSGGYQVMSQFNGKYPYTPEEYVAFVDALGPDFYASMDFACEPDVVRKTGRSVKQNIEETIDLTIKLMDLASSSKLVPVIQGWQKEDYLNCIDKMKEHDLITDYIAVGSLCRRGQTKKIRKIIHTIKSVLPSNVKLHAFGVKIAVIKDPDIFHALYSCDSMAWLSPAMHGKLTIFSGERLVETYPIQRLKDVERGYITLKGYKEYIEYVIKEQSKALKTLPLTHFSQENKEHE